MRGARHNCKRDTTIPISYVGLSSNLYAELAERPAPEKLRRALGLAKGATFAEAQTVSLYIAASNGNVQAAREIREGIEGKASERPRLGDIDEVVLRIVEERRAKKPEASQDTRAEASPETTPEAGPGTTEK